MKESTSEKVFYILAVIASIISAIYVMSVIITENYFPEKAPAIIPFYCLALIIFGFGYSVYKQNGTKGKEFVIIVACYVSSAVMLILAIWQTIQLLS